MDKYDHYEDELDAIRIKLYEQTKDMTSEEHAKFFNNKARQSAEKYGFKIIQDVSEGIYALEKRLYADKVSDI
jgi:hypothetical protein